MTFRARIFLAAFVTTALSLAVSTILVSGQARQRLRTDIERTLLQNARLAAEFAPLFAQWQREQSRQLKSGNRDPQLDQFRWLLEELRVQLSFILESEDRNTVFWIERRGGAAQPAGGIVALPAGQKRVAGLVHGDGGQQSDSEQGQYRHEQEDAVLRDGDKCEEHNPHSSGSGLGRGAAAINNYVMTTCRRAGAKAKIVPA